MPVVQYNYSGTVSRQGKGETYKTNNSIGKCSTLSSEAKKRSEELVNSFKMKPEAMLKI